MKPEFERFEYTGRITCFDGILRMHFEQPGWTANVRVGVGSKKLGYLEDIKGHNDRWLTLEETKLLLMKLR